MNFKRMIMEKESPEEMGYDKIKFNLSESSISDRRLSELGIDLDDLLLFYGDHSGTPALRKIIGEEHYGLCQDSILLNTGACMSLFIVNATLLSPGDTILVVSPNYATNIEVPKSLGANVDTLMLTFDRQYKLDLDEVACRVTPSTKLISVTYPHNPSGVIISEAELRQLVTIAERNDCYLLVDETYRELTFKDKLPPAAALSKKAISVESLSKSYGVPGVRLGWLATQDRALMERFLATKEQVCICGSVVDEHIALEIFRQRDHLLARSAVAVRENFSLLKEWMNAQNLLEWVEPSGGVVCFPRFKTHVSIDCAMFYRSLLEKYDTFVGPGRWFDQSDRYFRIGYGWPSKKELLSGLDGILRAADEAMGQPK